MPERENNLRDHAGCAQAVDLVFEKRLSPNNDQGLWDVDLHSTPLPTSNNNCVHKEKILYTVKKYDNYSI